ncbi:type II secretion system protein GspM [Caenimonas terrae]|uniref:Type II secretion system protein GspM n=1 Tax=Caenimonas terrae TaxID=696074 RepID=A0ABW0N6X1_9BURK
MIAPALSRKWGQLAPREQHLVAAAAGLVAAALLWWLLLAPPLAVMRTAQEQHRSLDAQLQQMQGLQAQAQALQSQPRQTADEAGRLLEATVRERLGTGARMTLAGERVTVALAGVAPEALGQWLAQARTNARVLPTEAHLTRNPAGLWDGTLVLALPAR